MNRWNKFWYSGLWAIPPTIAILLYVIEKLNLNITWDFNGIVSFIVLSCLPALYIYSTNLSRYLAGQRTFGLLTAFDPVPTQYSHSHKNTAMYPPITPELLHRKPTGIVYGQSQGQFVCQPMEDGDDIFHHLLIGSSGSGKTAGTILDTLLANPNLTCLVYDLKGEISRKSRRLDDPNTLIVDISRRDSHGYDPFFPLRGKDPPTKLVIETMEQIAYSLIPVKPNSKGDDYWTNSARQMLQGLLIYAYLIEKMTEFIDIIDFIMSKPIKELINDVIDRSRPTQPHYKLCIAFKDQAEETLTSTYGTLSTALYVFAMDADLRYALCSNPNKLSLDVLGQGKSVFIVIPESRFDELATFLHLITNQAIKWGESRDERKVLNPIWFCLDEAPRILEAGKINSLLTGIRVLRSKKISIFITSQGISSLSAYSKEEREAIISNVRLIILDVRSAAEQKEITQMIGKYSERKVTWSGTSFARKQSISYEKRDIVEPSDLVTLPKCGKYGECILLSEYGYLRFKKVPYYVLFKERAEKIRKYNDKIFEIMEES